MKQFIKAHINVKGDDIQIIASDETLDRHGDVLKLESWDLSEFKKAPRLLVDHDHRVEKIVGKAENTHIDKSIPGLVFTPHFHNITELARNVEEMVKQGFLDTVSVGFIHHGPDKDGGIDRYELIEVSFVTVGANPNARIKSLMDGEDVDDNKKSEIETFYSEKEIEKKEEVKEKKVAEKCVSCEDTINGLKAKLSGLEKENGKLKSLCEKQRQALTRQKNLNKLAAVAMLKEVARTVNMGLYKINKNLK